MSEALAFLTSAPSKSYSITPTDTTNIWNTISSADASKYIITAGTPGATGGDTSVNAVGLALQHAYTVVGAYTLKNQDGTVKAQVFKMRNPWGVDG
jgi:hypothetical protein